MQSIIINMKNQRKKDGLWHAAEIPGGLPAVSIHGWPRESNQGAPQMSLLNVRRTGGKNLAAGFPGSKKKALKKT